MVSLGCVCDDSLKLKTNIPAEEQYSLSMKGSINLISFCVRLADSPPHTVPAVYRQLKTYLIYANIIK